MSLKNDARGYSDPALYMYMTIISQKVHGYDHNSQIRLLVYTEKKKL